MSSGQNPIFDPKAIRAVGECFEQLIGKEDSEDHEVLGSLLKMATQSAQLDSVQKSILKSIPDDPALATSLWETKQLFDNSKYPAADDSKDANDEPKKDNKSFFLKIVDWFKKILNKLKQNWNACRNWICEKLKTLFTATKAILSDIAELVRKSIHWIFTSLLDPTGNLRKTLEDPTVSKTSKVLAVTAMIARALVTSLMCAYGQAALCCAPLLTTFQRDILPQNIRRMLATLNEHKGDGRVNAYRTNGVSEILIPFLISLATTYSKNLNMRKGD
eukprot:g8818.t1